MTQELKAAIEALIFVSLEPVTMEKLKSVMTDYADKDIEASLQDLMADYADTNRGIQITSAAGGYIFVTKPEHDPWIKSLLNLDKKGRISPAALETLSIIAYHQPITLAEISALRGVDSTHSLKTLLVKRLVKITGRKKSPGKPLIYRTATKFLTYFGLNSLNDLPTKEEIENILDEDEDTE